VPGRGGIYDLEINGTMVFSKHGLSRKDYPDDDEILSLIRVAIGAEVLEPQSEPIRD
jgi:hypothetical protein